MERVIIAVTQVDATALRKLRLAGLPWREVPLHPGHFMPKPSTTSKRDPKQPLRIAFLIYRGNPHCGGQGVYSRHLTRELTELGHAVTMFAGQPWPVADDPVVLEKVPGLDLYQRENPFRVPWLHEFRTPEDVREFSIMAGGGFPEPSAFSYRVYKQLRHRRADFDLVHDNQCLGRGLLGFVRDGWPFINTLHHPITVDRDLDLSHATTPWRKLTLRRWYGFLGMQMKVARQLPRHLTVSENSKTDIVAQMGVSAEALHIVPVGVDQQQFRPLPHIERVPGRLMTTASADVPLKGLTYLIDALAKVRTEREDAHLVVIGRPRHKSAVPRQIERLGLQNAVEFVSGVSDERIVELYAEAEIAVVPSLYEGFSLPAVEAMACGVPLVTTTGGALPEVVGRSGDAAMTVPTADPGALAQQIVEVLDNAELRGRLGEGGRGRVLDRFTWRRTAEGTAEHYYLELEAHASRRSHADG
ncbi:MAG TPA: glycosyltransferase family 4 protein [Acidimicrobiia bacterium]|nr:glycosyltransferase family 4 protein [Acidimicrobiia bacterium]